MDPDLVETLVDSSHATLQWMREQGVRFQVSYGRQAVKVNGRYKFWWIAGGGGAAVLGC
ncbi:MAG: hypothetical protein KIT18_00290 [Burkholderiales bacterium]|nr:hypothetical protein [Burkholderiales bacterium]